MNSSSSLITLLRKYSRAKKAHDDRLMADLIRNIANDRSVVFAQLRSGVNPVAMCADVYDDTQMRAFFERAVFDAVESQLREVGVTQEGFGMRLITMMRRVFSEELRYASVSTSDTIPPVEIKKGHDIEERTAVTPAEKMESANLRQATGAFLKGLSCRDRRILKSYAAGRSDAAIAKMLGFSREFVRVRRVRAFAELKAILLG